MLYHYTFTIGQRKNQSSMMFIHVISINLLDNLKSERKVEIKRYRTLTALCLVLLQVVCKLLIDEKGGQLETVSFICLKFVF